MCGIVGVAGDIGLVEEKAFKTLLELDTVRGPHSTGVIVVDKKGDSHFEKELGTPWEFYDESKIFSTKGMYKGQCKVLIGHNRWATTGDITTENAHPFDFNKVIGVHNGTLSYTGLRALEGHDKFEVDSEALYHNINAYGVKKTIEKTSGAYSLVWWDKEKSTVGFLRNAERPMFYMFTKNKSTVFWASEDWMLLAMCQRNKMDFGKPFKTKADRLYTLSLKDKDDKDKLSYEYYPTPLKSKVTPVDRWYSSGGPYTVNNHVNSGKVWCYKTNKFRTPADISIEEAVSAKLKKSSTLKKAKSLDVYYQPNAGDCGDGSVASFIVMKECDTNKKVRVIIPANHYMRKIILSSNMWDFFTIIPNNKFTTFDSATGTTSEGFIAQVNSLKGPFEYATNKKLRKKKRAAAEKFDRKRDKQRLRDLESRRSNTLRLSAPEEKDPILYIGYEGSMFTEEDMNDILKDGCSWCDDNSHTHKTLHEVIWVGPKEYLCGTCDGNEFIPPHVIN